MNLQVSHKKDPLTKSISFHIKKKWFAIIGLISLFSSIQNIEALDWVSPQQVGSDVSILGLGIDLGSSGTTAAIGWSNQNAIIKAFYSTSSDKGVNWTTPAQITNSGIESYSPFFSTAIQGTNYIRITGLSPFNSTISKRTTDGGATWFQDTLNGLGVGDTNQKNVAISGDYLATANTSEDTGTSDLFVYFYRTIFDNSTPWNSGKQVSNNLSGTLSNVQSIGINGTNGLVAFTTGPEGTSSFFANVTTDFTGGNSATWGSQTALGGGTFNIGTTPYLQTAVSPSPMNKALAVFLDVGSNTIYFSHKPDLAAMAWTAPASLAATGANSFPQLAVSEDGSNAILIWNDSGTIKYRLSTNFGSSWATAASLSTDVRANGVPQVAISSNGATIMVIWLSSTGISSQISTDSGANWSALTDPSTDVNAVNPQLALYSDASGAIAAWTDGAFGNTTKIYSNYYGTPPSPPPPPPPPPSPTPTPAPTPSVAVTGSTVQVGTNTFSGVVEWAVPDNLITGPVTIKSLVVYRGLSATKLKPIKVVPVTDPANPPSLYNDPNLQKGATYFYRIDAKLSDGSTYQLTATSITI